MNIVVLGGGVSGLVAAQAALEANANANVCVVEKGPNVGGLLSGITYQDGSYYDTGTHIFQETGNAEYDDIFLKSIPREDLIKFQIGKGDVNGIVYNNILQTNSHYPDLRASEIKKKLKDFLESKIEDKKAVPSASLQSRHKSATLFSQERFGIHCANEIIDPIIENVFKCDASLLTAFSFELLGLTRLVVDDWAEWKVASSNPIYRSLVGPPDQRKLPSKFMHSRKSYYSKKDGSKSFITGIRRGLLGRGCKFLCKSSVEQIDVDNNLLYIKNDNNQKIEIEYDCVISTLGAIGSGYLFDKIAGSLNIDAPLEHHIFDFKLTEPPTSDLFYFYSGDSASEYFRVTNYAAFSGRKDDCRLTVEVLGPIQGSADTKALAIISQLQAIGFLNTKDYCLLGNRKLPAGFPLPSVMNLNFMQDIFYETQEGLPDNVLLGGIGSEGGLFFQNEVAPDAYVRTKNFVSERA